MIDKELLEIRASPLDTPPVRLVDEGGTAKILCSRCGRRYPVRDDIPVMLEEEAEIPSSTGGTGVGGTGAPGAGAGDR